MLSISSNDEDAFEEDDIVEPEVIISQPKIQPSDSVNSVNDLTEMAVTKQDMNVLLAQFKADLLTELRSTIATEIKNELINELKSTIVAEVKTSIKEDIDRLEGRIFDLEQSNDRYKQEIEKLQAHEKEVLYNDTKKNVLNAKQHAVNNEQYSRRHNIRVFGIPEKNNENCAQIVHDLLKQKLNLRNAKISDIDVAHRVGPVVKAKTRAIIVRFISHSDKMTVIKSRRQLKGSGITISEDLCPDLQALLSRLHKDDATTSTWAWNGKVYFKNQQNMVFRAEYGETIADILSNPERQIKHEN